VKRVVILNQFALPRTEGGGTRHIDLFSRVEGWSPVIIAGNRNHYTQMRFTTNDQQMRLVSVPSSNGSGGSRIVGWLLYSAKAFALALSQRNVDLIYGSTPHLLAPLAAMAAARLRRIPFILEVRDLWPESIVSAGQIRKGGLLHRSLAVLERILVINADAVVAVTEGWETHFSALGVDRNKVAVVPNGTEPVDFCVDASKDQLRDEFGLRGFTAVFAGAHGPKDGIELILDAAAACPGIQFLLVGAGTEKQRAIDRARSQNLKNVEFHPPVPKTELARLLRACDVGIHAVTPLSVFGKGMSPNKLFDYMAAGLPIVSNAAHAISRIVTNDECGRLGDQSALAECLAEVKGADDAQRLRWSERAQAIVAARYSRRAAAIVLKGILEKAVEERMYK